MKKFILMMAIAFGMIAMPACTSCDNLKEGTDFTQVVYDVTATAKGMGQFAWAAAPHTGDITLNGELAIRATNDTTAKALFASVPNGAPTLAQGLVSENADEAAAAEEVRQQLSVTHLTGEYQLDATGYAKFGPFYFVINEHYPPLDSVAVATTCSGDCAKCDKCE